MNRAVTGVAVGFAAGVATTTSCAALIMDGAVSMSLTPGVLLGQAWFFVGVAVLLAAIWRADVRPLEVTT